MSRSPTFSGGSPKWNSRSSGGATRDRGSRVRWRVTGLGGHTFQLLPEIAAAAPGFSGRGIDPVRLGHFAILTTDAAAAVIGFLTDGLGFSTTDWFEDFVTFVTCNRDHHVLNVIQAPFATMHHLAFLLDGRDHQSRAVDRLARAALGGPPAP